MVEGRGATSNRLLGIFEEWEKIFKAKKFP